MVRGPKKHLKRLNAPKSWMLDKLTGVFAPKPAPGASRLIIAFFFFSFLRSIVVEIFTRNFNATKRFPMLRSGRRRARGEAASRRDGGVECE